MEGEEIGRVTVEIIPTKHLVERCRERLAGLLSVPSKGCRLSVSGTLIAGRWPGTAYLDVDGIGRFVLAELDGEFIDITYLPQIHCHQNCGGS